MEAKILLFGIAKDIMGGSVYPMALAQGSTVGQLKAELLARFPRLGGLASLAVAVNNAYALDGQVIGPGDEIALIPPVSGG